ncbi:DNA-binding WRKY transcription factor [Tanacetum coccineum]
MIRCRSEVEESVRMISSMYSSKPLSRNCKAKNSPYGSRFDNMAKCLIAVDALADNVDIWWARNKYPGLAFTIPTLERVTIGCCEVGGGGGGVVGGVGVVCGDSVYRGVGGVDCGAVCGFVKTPISAMIVRVPEKDRWCGTRGVSLLMEVEERILILGEQYGNEEYSVNSNTDEQCSVNTSSDPEALETRLRSMVAPSESSEVVAVSKSNEIESRVISILPDAKRQKKESAGVNDSAATKTNYDPRVVVATTSPVDIVNDGYRWRKYGQKLVKGNPNPRYVKWHLQIQKV